MGRRLYLAYPALLAVVPILYRQVQNPGPTIADTLAFSAMLAAAIVLVQFVGYALLRAPLRRPGVRADLAAALAAVAVVLFYRTPAISDAAHAYATEGSVQWPAALLVAGLAGVLVALGWVAWRGGERARSALGATSRFLASAATLLVAWFGLRIAVAPARVAWYVHRSPFIRDLTRPVPTPNAPAAGPPRDVYVLLLDAYPSADALREVYGIENTPVLDSLRALGFRVPAQLRSNFPITLLSVPTLLNFADLRPLTEEMPRGYHDYGVAGYLFTHDRAARFLKARGYQTVFFPSVWFAPTRHNREADVEFPGTPGFDPWRAINRSLLVEGFTRETLLRPLLRFVPTRQAMVTNEVVRTFRGVAALAARPAGGPPVYAFAHLLMPHGDFNADSTCRPHPRGTTIYSDGPPDDPAVRAAAAGYVACANRQVLATVHAILARPGARPIIILQGDHGTTARGLLGTHPDSITPEQVRERFTPFGAYYLPDGGAAALPDTLSIVNVLRTVFSYYYGADLPPLPNAMYYVDVGKSYHATPIDTLRLRPVRGAAPESVARESAERIARPASVSRNK